jgi:hypothetical protein
MVMPEDPNKIEAVQASMLERLIRIEVILETKYNEMARQLNDHEIRLRAQESWSYAAPVALLIALGSAVAAVITALGG